MLQLLVVVRGDSRWVLFDINILDALICLGKKYIYGLLMELFLNPILFCISWSMGGKWVPRISVCSYLRRNLHSRFQGKLNYIAFHGLFLQDPQLYVMIIGTYTR